LRGKKQDRFERNFFKEHGMGSGDVAIGVDLGGTKIEAAVVTAGGGIQKSVHRFTDVENGPSRVTRQVVEMVLELCRDCDRPPVGVGLGVAGQVEAHTGMVHFAPNLVWHRVPLQTNLIEALNLPVRVDNDVRMATWGEWVFGAGRTCKDLVCIYVGTGVGGGIVSGGHILSGHHNTAGEIGHMTIDLNGPACTCGNHGCLEAVAGGWAIADKARKAVAGHPLVGATMLKMAGNRIPNITAEIVARAFGEKDPLAIRIINGVVEGLVAGTATLVNMCSPERIIMGGGVIEGLPELIGRVAQGVRQRALAAAMPSLQVVPAELGATAAIIGAAARVMKMKV
jgi:glucokinase